MVSSKIKALADAKSVVARLEQSITEELASLHSDYGFESVEVFIAAVKSASRGKVRGPGRPRKVAKLKTRKRAKITDATRAQLKKLVKSGKTGAQIAKALKISLPSVQNIKNALGLVKSAKKKTTPKRKARRKPVKKTSAPKARKKRAAPKRPTPPEPKPAQTSIEPAPSTSA